MEKRKNATSPKKGRKSSKSILLQVSDKFKSRELFPEKIEKAKKFLGNLKSLPV
jgi:hypothetical protein